MRATDSNYKVFDIRKFPIFERNFRVMNAFEGIDPHCCFVVVTDQAPVSLQKEFEGELKDRFSWEVIQNGPPEWKVLITKISD